MECVNAGGQTQRPYMRYSPFGHHNGSSAVGIDHTEVCLVSLSLSQNALWWPSHRDTHGSSSPFALQPGVRGRRGARHLRFDGRGDELELFR